MNRRKNPALTDEEFEVFNRFVEAAVHDVGNIPGLTREGRPWGNWYCPRCEIDMNKDGQFEHRIHSVNGDLSLTCPNGHETIFPMLRSEATDVTEGTPLW